MRNPATLRAHTDLLAAEGHWETMRDLLAQHPVEALMLQGVAYRFGEALYFTGQVRELAEHAMAYQRVARAAADPPATLGAINLAGIAAFELGRMTEASSAFEELMEGASAEGLTDLQAKAANNLGALANLSGNPEKALAFYQLAIPLHRRLGSARGLAQTHHNMGMSFRDLGSLDDAADAYRHAAEIAHEHGFLPQAAMSMIGRAEIEVMRGDPQFGLRMADWGRTLALQVGDQISAGTALRIAALARLELQPPDWAAAMSDLAFAATIARDTGHALLRAEVIRDLGRLEGRRGRLDAAARHLEDARRALSELGATGQVSMLDADLAELSDGSEPSPA